MKNAGKLLLSSGLIVVSGAYAWWHHSTETQALTHMALALRQARQPAPASQPAPVAQTAPPAPSTPPPVQTPSPSDSASTPPPPVAEPKAATKPEAPQSDAALKEAMVAGTPAPPPPPPVAAPPPPPPPEASAPGAPGSGHFKDGDFVGQSFDGEWGPVQVKIAVRGGNVVQVVCIEYPFHRERSAEISEYAIPILVEETIKTQDSKIDWVSQASYTSEQFQESLVSAMAKAGKAPPT